MLWLLMLCAPLPYIANTAGWMTKPEDGINFTGLIAGLYGTSVLSPRVGAGNVWFTLIGFMGMYTVLAILWLFLVWREIEIGPEQRQSDATRCASCLKIEEARWPQSGFVWSR